MVDFSGLLKTVAANQRDLFKDDTQVDTSGDMTTSSGVKLCDEQRDAAKTILSSTKPCCVLTGLAGSGKSTVVDYLRDTGMVTITATTGRAALNVGGVTVDTMFAMCRDDWTCWSHDFLQMNMANTRKIIVIDEASMVGRNMAEYIHSMIVESSGKRIVLVGDWAQAAPVKDSWIFGSSLVADVDFIKLKECHRQTDATFLTALNTVRGGDLDDATRDFFKSRICAAPPETTGFGKNFAARMFATNKSTDSYNQARLYELVRSTKVSMLTLRASFTDLRPQSQQDKSPRKPAWVESQLDSSRLAHCLNVCSGAVVVFTRNDPGKRWVNGSIGVIKGFGVNGKLVESPEVNPFGGVTVRDINWVTVSIDGDDAKTVNVEPAIIDQKSSTGTIQGQIKGFPIDLGWALTIHKCQGMTVNTAWVDISTILKFPEDGRHGLAYVALSRTRTAEGLQLSGWDDRIVYCDPIVRPFI